MPETISAEMSANIWKILVVPGDAVEEETPLIIMESMKMEIPVLAESPGVVAALRVTEGDMVDAGQPLIDIITD